MTNGHDSARKPLSRRKVVGVCAATLFISALIGVVWAISPEIDTTAGLKGSPELASAIPAPRETEDKAGEVARRAVPATTETESPEVAPEETVAAPEPSTHFPEQSVMDTVYGVIDVDKLLDAAIYYATLPVDPKVDLEEELSDGMAFRIKTEDSRVKAFFEIGKEPVYFPDGRQSRKCGVCIQQAPLAAPWFVEGVARDGPRMHVAMIRDPDGNPESLMILAVVAVALGDSKDYGIDAYQGTYPEGLYYSCYFDPQKPISCKKVQVVNGHYQMSEAYPAIEGVGNLNASPEKLKLLNEKFGKLIGAVTK